MGDKNARRKNARDIFILVVSALGMVYFFGQAFTLGVVWLVTLFDPQPGLVESISMGLLVWSSILAGLLLLPIVILSIYRLRGQTIPAWFDTRQPVFRKTAIWIILAWPIVVFIGWYIAGMPSVAVFLLGPINLLVAGIPILWVYHASQRELDGGSQLRKWGVLGFSLTIMPVLVIIAELVALLVLGGFGGLWLVYRFSVDPQIERELMFIFNRIMILGDDLEAIIQFLEPYLFQPSVIFWVLAAFAGIMPIIEEVLKPLALWFFADRKITLQQGFVGGLLCGAGFALMENVLYFTAVTLPEDWLFMAIGRAGTGVLHMLASGLVGMGLAKAWRKGNWRFLILTSGAAFILHGFWNALALISGIAPIIAGEDISLWQNLLYHSPLFLLLIFSAFGMILINRKLRKAQLSHG